MTEALPLTDRISQTSRQEIDYRTIKVEYNDGYGQFTPDGINDEIREWAINYENINETERDTIWTFVQTVKRSTIFTWTPPQESDTMYWRINTKVKEQHLAGNIFTISFGIKRHYDQVS